MVQMQALFFDTPSRRCHRTSLTTFFSFFAEGGSEVGTTTTSSQKKKIFDMQGGRGSSGPLGFFHNLAWSPNFDTWVPGTGSFFLSVGHVCGVKNT